MSLCIRRLGAIVLMMMAMASNTPVAAQISSDGRVCEAVGFSPRFATDQTAFCIANEYAPNSSFPTGNLIVRKSTDGMATWESIGGAGLQGLGLAFPSQLIVSPEYPDSAALYVHVVYGNNPGLYRSTDDGATFANVAPFASTGYVERALSPFSATEEGLPSPLGSGRDAFAYATPAASGPAVVAPPLHRPVLGAPESTDAFLLPPAFPEDDAIALARGAAPESSPSAPIPQLAAYRCDSSLTCTTKAHDFPAGWVAANTGVTSNGVFYVVVKRFENQKEFAVWRSVPNGSFTEWNGLNRMLPKFSGDEVGLDPRVSIVGSPTAEGVYYARVSFQPESGQAGPPADQVFQSVDGGETWRRRSFGRTYTQRGRTGTIPWGRRMGALHAEGDLYMPSSDRLVVIAQSRRKDGSTYTGVFCSFDRGRTWTEGCASPL